MRHVIGFMGMCALLFGLSSIYFLRGYLRRYCIVTRGKTLIICGSVAALMVKYA